MQSEIANKYGAYESYKEFKSLFERTNHHRREKIKKRGPSFTANDLGDTVAAKQCLFHVENKNTTKHNPNESDSSII